MSGNGTNGANGHTGLAVLGRPTDYRPEFCKALLDWFDGPRTERVVKRRRTIRSKNGDVGKEVEYETITVRMPTIEGFADSLGHHQQIIHAWRRAHPDFQEAYARAKDRQHDWMVELGAKNLMSAGVYVILATNLTAMRSAQPPPAPRNTIFFCDPFKDHRALTESHAERADTAARVN